jgi:prepilin-type N-terminal cleavage/methylation domain-containing protein
MKGITIIELLLVIAIFGILAASTTPFLSSFLIRNNWHVTVDRVASEIYKAQGYAMSGKVINGSDVWGVCITGSVFRMFNGTCATPNYREDFTIPNQIMVSGITSVTFDGLRGGPSSVSTITVNAGLGSNTVTINGAGMVDVN